MLSGSWNGDADGEVAAREPSVGRIEQLGLVRGRLLPVGLEVSTAFCTAITGTLASLARGVVELRQTRRLHGGGGAIGGWKLGGLERGDVEIGEALTAQLLRWHQGRVALVQGLSFAPFGHEEVVVGGATLGVTEIAGEAVREALVDLAGERRLVPHVHTSVRASSSRIVM